MRYLLTIPLVLACSLTGALAGEAEPNTLTPQEKKEGWKLLFDGKTLKGWNHWGKRKALEPGGWSAQDGTLHLSKGGGDIYTAEPYENFDLSLEWKTTGNSGILLRVDPSTKGPIWRFAPEMQIERKNAAYLYDLIPIKGKLKIHPDGWNHVRIRLVNGHGTHWFNGDLLYEYQIGSDDWKARVAKSKFKKDADKFGMTARGHIGLQDHGAAVSFRNLKIRELPADAKK